MNIKCPCCNSINTTQIGDTVTAERDLYYNVFNDDIITKINIPVQLCLECECRFSIIKYSDKVKKEENNGMGKV